MTCYLTWNRLPKNRLVGCKTNTETNRIMWRENYEKSLKVCIRICVWIRELKSCGEEKTTILRALIFSGMKNLHDISCGTSSSPSVLLSARMSINVPLYLCECVSVSLLVWLTVCLSTWITFCLPACLCVCQAQWLSVHLSIYVSVCRPVC